MSEVDYLRLEVEGDPPAGKLRNLIQIPDLGRLPGGFGWVTPTPGASLQKTVDADSLTFTSGGDAGAGVYFMTDDLAVTAGNWLSFRWHVVALDGYYRVSVAFGGIEAQFADGWGVPLAVEVLSATGGDPGNNVTGSDVTAGPVEVPAGAIKARMVFDHYAGVDGTTAAPADDTLELTQVAAVEQSTDTPVDWSDVVDEVDWIDILGPTHDIEVDRGALQLGTLTATILDSNIDPATAETLATGRRCRVMALNAETAEWQPLITATIDRATVKYDTKLTATQPDSPKVARISLTALDAVSVLSQQPRPDGVGTVDELRSVVQGTGVPWCINGFTSQIAGAVIVSRNESASAVDQVAITRDTRSAYAWLDQDGVLQVWDRDQMPVVTGEFEDAGDADTWSGFGCTLAATTDQVFQGALSLEATADGDPRGSIVWSDPVPAVPGRVHVFAARVRAATTGRDVRVRVEFLLDGVPVLNELGTVVADVSTGWSEASVSVVTPPGARQMRVGVELVGANVLGEVHYIDHVTGFDPPALVDEEAYSDVELTYDSESFINSVVITFLRYDPVTAETTEIKYGPYVNPRAGGREKRAEFTIHGVTEDAATMEAFATAVLAANGSPEVTCQSVELPIREHGDVIADRALLDLYRRVRVMSAARGFDKTVRLTGVRHRIAPGKWLMTLTFAPMGSVASPQLTPPVPPKPEDEGIPATLTNGWTNAEGVAAYGKVNGRTWIEGTVAGGTPSAQVFQLPEGYRPSARRIFVVSEGGSVPCRLDVQADGVVIAPTCTDNDFLSLNVSFRAEQ